MLQAGLQVARKMYESQLNILGAGFELRKRLQDRPDRSDSDIETAYGRKDPTVQEPVDWNDPEIFQQPDDSSEPVIVRIWVKTKTREEKLYEALQGVTDKFEATTSLESQIEEGDVLINGSLVYEVTTVNCPSFGICLDISLLKRG